MFNFLKDGNGIITCYNFVSPPFNNVDEMIAYLPTVKEMGCNAVLIHLLPDSDNNVDSIKKFTEAAHRCGLVSLCDLNFTDETKILEQFWKPYLQQCILEFGYEGVRLCGMASVPSPLREAIFDYVNDLTQTNNKHKPVIFDDSHYSEKSCAEIASLYRTKSHGPTHMTSSCPRALHNTDGRLPSWVKQDENHLLRVIYETEEGGIRIGAKGGCINYSSQSNHPSLAMRVLLEMANEQLIRDPKMNQIRERFNKKLNAKDQIVLDEKNELIFLYPYVKDIIKEIRENNSVTSNEYHLRMQARLTISALAASGGWYVQAGDEQGAITPQSILTIVNDDSVNLSESENRIFSDPTSKQVVQAVLKKMAEDEIQQDTLTPREQDALFHDGMSGAYAMLREDPAARERLLTAYIDRIKNEINAGDEKRCEQFADVLKSVDPTLVFNREDRMPVTTSYTIEEEHSSDMRQLIFQLNQLLSKLPASNLGFWAEIIRMPDNPDLFIAVRKNGFGFDSSTDVVIMSLDPSKKIMFGNRELETLAKCFQDRTVKCHDATEENPSRDAAYRCIISASLHPAESIVLTVDRVHDTALNESGKKGFQQHSVFAAPQSSKESDTAGAAQTKKPGEPNTPI
jgi:alpha-amylase